VIYNSKYPSKELVHRYAREKEFPVEDFTPKLTKKDKTLYVGGDLLNKRIPMPKKGDPIQRNLIRHNPDKLAELIVSVLNRP
jgi:hypothetical protein